MKKLILCLLIGSPIAAYSQAGSAKESRALIEIAASKKGVLLKKDFRKLGEVRGIRFDHLKVEDLTTKVKYYGVEVGYSGNTGFIDSDELKTLLKAVELVRDSRLDPMPGTIYEFMCKGGFNLEFFWVKDKWYMRMGIGEKYREKESYTIDTTDILMLVKIMSDASAII